MRTFLLGFGGLVLSAALAWGEPFPALEATSLSGKKVQLPAAAKGRTAILIAGFTQASSHASEAWQKQLARDYGADPKYVIYSLAVLDEVPRLVRGLVTGSMRKGTPAARQDLFLYTFQDGKAWKRLARYTAKDDAYVIAIDPRGELLFAIHGASPEGQDPALRERLKASGDVFAHKRFLSIYSLAFTKLCS